jgi:hypothetical protein
MENDAQEDRPFFESQLTNKKEKQRKSKMQKSKKGEIKMHV